MEKIDRQKIASSGISGVMRIAVIEVYFVSNNKVIDELSYEQEKHVDFAMKRLSKENHSAWIEENKIKSITCEFIQFFIFNFHLNFLTCDYQFSLTDKPNLTGFSIASKNRKYFYETDKMEFSSTKRRANV